MNIFRNFDEAAEIKNPVVTTGSFDGVHVGHKVIIDRLNRLAEEINGESTLITFNPHPRKVLYPDTLGKDLKLINTQNEKIALLRKAGLKNLIIVEFTKDFAKTTSYEFVNEILVKKLHFKVIIVGFNHHFGHNREGDYSYLYKLSSHHGFAVEEIPEQDIQNETVSSTKIRKALTEGNIQRANAYLDHFYIIMGKIGSGNQHLSEMGFQTLTIQLEEDIKLIPPQGVYAIRLKVDNNNFKGMLNIMRNDLSDENPYNSPLIEFHLFTHPGQHVTGKTGTLYFHKRIRDFLNFGTRADLFKQLLKDKENIEELIY